jgi:tetratricopeptide (TPR) repeat protein
MQMFEHAIALDPSFALAYAGVATSCALIHEWHQTDARWIEKGRAACERALFSSPRLQEAAELAERAIEANDDDCDVYVPFGNALRRLRGGNGAEELRRREVKALKRQLQWVPEDARARILLAGGYAFFGEKENAARELERAVALRPNDSNILYNAACTYGILGMKAEALATFRKAIAAGYNNLAWAARDADLACLRDHPEFQQLLGRAANPA